VLFIAYSRHCARKIHKSQQEIAIGISFRPVQYTNKYPCYSIRVQNTGNVAVQTCSLILFCPSLRNAMWHWWK